MISSTWSAVGDETRPSEAIPIEGAPTDDQALAAPCRALAAPPGAPDGLRCAVSGPETRQPERMYWLVPGPGLLHAARRRRRCRLRGSTSGCGVELACP